MSKLTDSFRTVRCFNSYQFYLQDDPEKKVPYITREYGQGRTPYFSGWAVALNGVNLYGENPPYYVRDQRGGSRKTFHTLGHGKRGDRGAGALAAAQAWASERFGIEDWARDPYGTYGPAEFVKARVASLKKAVAEAADVA